MSHSMKSQHVLHLSSVTTEDEFYQRDMSFIHQEIIWVISESRPSHKILRSLNSALSGFILMPTHKSDSLPSDVNIISEFVHGNINYHLASSVQIQRERNYVTVKVDENYLSVIKKELEKAANNNWKSDQEDNFVVLTGKQKSITSTISIMEEADRLPHSNLLRYVFSDQDQSTRLSHDPCDRKILRDVRQNIFMNGVWGTLRLLSTQLKGKESSSINADDKLMYPLSSVVANTDISTLGLNVTDVTATLQDDNLGVFDFVTSTEMGLAQYDGGLKTLISDNILKWNIPAAWTTSEAATVPLLYSMATTILYFREDVLGVDKSILITKGTLPLSQAIITLALHDPQVSVEELFVTTGSDDETNELMIMFPKLKRGNIIDHGKNDIYIQLKRLTNGKGVSKIVCNFEDIERTVGAINSVPFQYGIVILASQAPMSGGLETRVTDVPV
uniref:Fatty acid synthase n=1 Tax=Lygus hesperus TaxID=30085 RepID=A0A0A9XPY1_LYGHE